MNGASNSHSYSTPLISERATSTVFLNDRWYSANIVQPICAASQHHQSYAGALLHGFEYSTASNLRTWHWSSARSICMYLLLGYSCDVITAAVRPENGNLFDLGCERATRPWSSVVDDYHDEPNASVNYSFPNVSKVRYPLRPCRCLVCLDG